MHESIRESSLFKKIQQRGGGCGCFGKDEPEHKFFSNLRVAIIRDLFLLLPVTYLYWHGWLNRHKTREIQNGNK